MRSLLLLAIAFQPSALHLPQDLETARADWKTVLILGDSVDRYALSDNFQLHNPFTPGRENTVVYASECGVALGYQFHPGVGYNGDMKPPFLTNVSTKRQTTEFIIRKVAVGFSKANMGTATPDLVVVGSTLWDLAVWKRVDGYFPNATHFDQWCHSDLPHLLGNVSKYFPSSRIAFRTNPGFRPENNLTKFNNEGVEGLYQCIIMNTVDGKLFGQYEVIDYHDIMKHLLLWTTKNPGRMSSLWREDSYHPTMQPGRLYINEVLRLVGATPLNMIQNASALLGSQRGRPTDFDDAGLN